MSTRVGLATTVLLSVLTIGATSPTPSPTFSPIPFSYTPSPQFSPGFPIPSGYAEALVVVGDELKTAELHYARPQIRDYGVWISEDNSSYVVTLDCSSETRNPTTGVEAILGCGFVFKVDRKSFKITDREIVE